MDPWRVSGLTRAEDIEADPIIGTIDYEHTFVQALAGFLPGIGAGVPAWPTWELGGGAEDRHRRRGRSRVGADRLQAAVDRPPAAPGVTMATRTPWCMRAPVSCGPSRPASPPGRPRSLGDGSARRLPGPIGQSNTGHVAISCSLGGLTGRTVAAVPGRARNEKRQSSQVRNFCPGRRRARLCTGSGCIPNVGSRAAKQRR